MTMIDSENQKSTTLPWIRYWCGRDQSYALSHTGYLPPPGESHYRTVNVNLRRSEDIATIPCLILLGEPGIGKTSEIEGLYQTTKSSLVAGDTIHRINLRSVGSEATLYRELFDHPRFVAWANATQGTLHLFLDSLDECLLRVETIAALLAENLSQCPAERLFIRIACRTAEWPGELELALRRLYTQKHDEEPPRVGVFELLPLCEQDVALAAQNQDVETGAFLASIAKARATPFASKPVTLFLLLSLYESQGELPASRRDLYYQGCLKLCEETDHDRHRRVLRHRNLTPEQRLIVAARIAAITQFSNRYALLTHLTSSPHSPELITLSDIIGGTESVRGSAFEVTELVVREALDTGLFTARGESAELMGWAHQTYAEFLAAWYLHIHHALPEQALSLLCHPDDPHHAVIPQLSETAAWVAGYAPAVREALLQNDPVVLLRSDVASLDEGDRAAIVTALLTGCAARTVSACALDRGYRLADLSHPGMAAQLRPVIGDTAAPEDCRWLAISFVEECKLQELQKELASVILAEGEPHSLRVHAAYALQRLGDATHRALLRPLLSPEMPEDPDDDLRGCLLKCLWPDQLSVEELFPVLTYPKRTNLYGAYKSFLLSEWAQSLQPEDLPIALEWAESENNRARRIVEMHPFHECFAGIGRRAWELLPDPRALDYLISIGLLRSTDYQSILIGAEKAPEKDLYRADAVKRRLFLGAFVQRFAQQRESAHDVFRFLHHDPPIALPDDAAWLIEQCAHAPTEEARRVYTDTVYYIGLGDGETFGLVWSAAQTNPLLRERFAPQWDPVLLGSEQAQREREWYRRSQERERRESEKSKGLAKLVTYIKKELLAFDKGDLDAWWRLNRPLTATQVERNGGYWPNDLLLDFTETECWKALDARTHERLLYAAERYLDSYTPPLEWLGSNAIYHPVYSGYRALTLLRGQAPDRFAALPDAIWERWAPWVVSCHVSGIGDEWERHRALLTIAYRRAPQTVIGTFVTLITTQREDGSAFSPVYAFEPLWDRPLIESVLPLLSGDVTVGDVVTLLSAILKRTREDGTLRDLHDKAKRIGEGVIASYLAGNEAIKERAISLAVTLFHEAQDASWAVLKEAVRHDSAFGDAILGSAGYHRHIGLPLSHIDEAEVEGVFLWLYKNYPPSSDPQHDGVHSVGFREIIGQHREETIAHLKQRGTAAACAAIERIAQALPELTYLPHVLIEAREQMRRMTWRPPTPAEVVELTADTRKRLVQSESQLLDVVIDSLGRMQRRFQGETPETPQLWDQQVGGGWRPKDENTLSDYIANRLRDDLGGAGFIISREVEIRRRQGESPGQETDIQVVAIPTGADNQNAVRVIIETKGCWNRELWTAMETQLANRYLHQNSCQHGVYLVGWYLCDLWDPTDSRRNATPKIPIADTLTRLKAQSAQIGRQSGLRIIPFVMDITFRDQPAAIPQTKKRLRKKSN